jgi:allantoin racemase
MKTKILWQQDNTLEQLSRNPDQAEFIFESMMQFAGGVARPTTELVVNFPTHQMGERFAPYYKENRVHLAVEVIERIKQAEEDGFDAAFAGMCYGEFFLRDARQAVKMPVVGPAESAMLLAQALGDRFAVVTVADFYIQPMAQNIRTHGWESRAISQRPVRAWRPAMSTLLFEAFDGRPDRLIEEFEQQALGCVEDGADVVICGCNPYGMALAQVGYNAVANTGVPVVTPLPAMIKQAESLVDLRRSLGIGKSEAMLSPYRSTPDDVLEDMAKHGIGLPAARISGQAEVEAYRPRGRSRAS